ncbi:MAG: ABC transporter ATP-binding protein [Trueperaceae bacterium]|nr:MAG: ABC transporter ATP-binding protein [Trueperaceae bacterium]
MAFLELKRAAMGYQRGELIVEDLELSIQEGELVSLLGPSGCGKTTTLRAIAGFITLQNGTLAIAGSDYTRIPPNRRNIGMVFQSYALFPHLSVFENVAFGLRLRRVAKEDLAQRVRSALDMVGLSGFDSRLPAQLSGGQQQRVATARAIVIEPQLLLLDEPLSNLDAKLRVEMRSELKRVQRRLGVTMIYVTHDQEEALALSDRVVVMNAGRIEQLDSPENVYQRPRTLFVAHFVGFSNHAYGTVAGEKEEFVSITLPGGSDVLSRAGLGIAVGGQATLTFRPSAARVYPVGEALPSTLQGALHQEGEVLMRTFKGDTVNYLVSTPLGEFEAEVEADMGRWREGERLQLAVPKEQCIAYPGGRDG